NIEGPLRRRNEMKAWICAIAILVASSVVNAADEWPNYRGPNNDGSTAEKLPATLTVKPLFKVEIGEGYSGVTAAGGHVFAMGNATGKDTIWCLDGTTGKEVWKHSYDCGTEK